MSELTCASNFRISVRRKLLLTASSLALISLARGTELARASGSERDRPSIWIELGGQLEHMDRDFSVFSPPFVGEAPTGFEVLAPQGVQRMPRYSYGGEGKISFRPEGGDWIFSAAARYGRSNGIKHGHVEITGFITSPGVRHIQDGDPRFADSRAKFSESHAILDFEAGRDIGLGLFGRGGTSSLSVGVRFAQFVGKSNTSISSVPDYHFKKTQLAGRKYFSAFHLFTGSTNSERSFRGIGPSVSWDSSIAIARSLDSAGINFDWGVNAAMLFGRQKQHERHSTTAGYFNYKYSSKVKSLYKHSTDLRRTRSVVVPNFGGFAGVSLNFPNAKVALGYRADLFFGAMDGGIDARKIYDRNFYGPFATISIGLGG